jgi:hypothetical protein
MQIQNANANSNQVKQITNILKFEIKKKTNKF